MTLNKTRYRPSEGAQVRPFPLPFPKNAFYLLVSTNLLRLSRDGVTCVAFKPDNPNIVVSGSNDKTIKTWDITSGSCLSTLRGHRYAPSLPKECFLSFG